MRFKQSPPRRLHVQTDRETLMAFMRTLRAPAAPPAAIVSTPIATATPIATEKPWRGQTDRTTLRAAMDRIAETRGR
jgi:spore germination protein YaaH